MRKKVVQVHSVFLADKNHALWTQNYINDQLAQFVNKVLAMAEADLGTNKDKNKAQGKAKGDDKGKGTNKGKSNGDDKGTKRKADDRGDVGTDKDEADKVTIRGKSMRTAPGLQIRRPGQKKR